MFERIKIVLDIHGRAFLDGPSTKERIWCLKKSCICINIDVAHASDGDLTESDLGLGDTEAEPSAWFDGAEMGEEAPCRGGIRPCP